MRLDQMVSRVPRVVVIEVTNTLQARSVTGYQRFVRAFLRELRAPGTPALDVLPVVWEAGGYRRLTASEDLRLTTAARALPAPSTTLVRRVPRGLLRRARVVLRRRLRVDVPAGAVFFDAEPAWHDPEPRSALLPSLKARGVRVVTMVADVLPVTHPQWFEPRVAEAFDRWLSAHLASTDLVLAISEHTRQQVRSLGDVPVQVVPLGADFDAADRPAPVSLPAGLERLLLVVGTLEPRKNQALALDLLDRLAPSYPDVGVVLVGKSGWLVEDLAGRIAAHPLHGTRLLHLSSCSDGELTWLYDRAFLALVPSWSEGLGLPVLEALRAGVPTLTSAGGALPEAGQGLAQLAAPDDLDTWERLVRAHLDDPAHHAAARERTRAFVVPTWSAAAQVVRECLAGTVQESR